MKYLSDRLGKIKSNLKKQKISQALISSPSNITYLTGKHQVSNSSRELFLLIDVKSTHLLASPLSVESYKHLHHIFNIHTLSRESTLSYWIKTIFSEENIYIEEENITVKEARILSNKTKKQFLGLPLTTFDSRETKDSTEVTYMKKAGKITQDTWREILPHIKPGITEHQVLTMIISSLLHKGADGIHPDFPPIVASGKNSAIPHHKTSHKKIEKEDVILVDFGCIVSGYCSDMTRTIKLGSSTKEYKSIENAVLSSYKKAITTLHKDTNNQQIDKIILNSLKEKKLDNLMIHTSGHGIGIDIHEPPSLSRFANKQNIKKNMTITIEPGLYKTGNFGYRHENTILIQEDKVVSLTG